MSVSQSTPPGGDNTIERSITPAETVTVAIVEALADLEGISSLDVPSELGIILYDHIDTEVVEAMRESTSQGDEMVISFEMTGTDHTYVVTVYPLHVSIERTVGSDSL